MGVTVFIPAKSTSSRIPMKNLIDVAGHPLISWTLKACQNWKVVDRVVVATDHDEIAKMAIDWGAEVMSLDSIDLEDQRTASDLWKYFCESQEGTQAIMYPTNPLRRIDELNRLWEAYQSSECDVIISMREERHCIMDHKGQPIEGPESRMTRLTQNVNPYYVLDGSYYISTAKYVRECSYFEEKNVRVFPVGKMSGIEIDDPEDLELARLVAVSTDWWNTQLE